MAMQLQSMVTTCRLAYTEFQLLASRTDAALYHALGQVHALLFQMRGDAALQQQFQKLLQQNSPGGTGKETLFLVKYAFFPHALQPGPGHQADITKASRYSKLINKALDHNIAPADFVAFARHHGIQRTAAGSRRPKLPYLAKRAPRRGKTPSVPLSAPEPPALLADLFRPRELWFCSAAVTVQFADLLQAAKQQPQKVSLTVYVDATRVVVAGITAKAWSGNFREGAVRISGTVEKQSAPSIRNPQPQPFHRAPGLPSRLRGTPLPPFHQ